MPNYRPYPAYQPSGIDWLGDIPTHWELWKLNHAYELIGSGTTPPSEEEKWFDGDIPWVTTGELRENVIIETTKNVSDTTIKKFSALKVYPKCSIAIAMYGATIGRLGIFGVDATTNQACCVLANSNYLDNGYVFHWLSVFREQIIQLSSGGGQPNINQEKVASLKISAPNIHEQQQIAAFLDRETAKIDQLIAKQQQLIELLKEKRQAVISHAVTKGLNPDVKMKPSGVEWLEDVPEHWVVAKFKYLTLESISGPYGSSLTKSMYTSNGVRVYGQQQVIPDDFSIGDYYISEEQFKDMRRYEVFPNDLLISVMGTIGKVAIAPEQIEKGIINPRLVKYKINQDKILPYFAKASILSDVIQSQLLLAAQGSTMDGLNMQIINGLPIAYPTLNEQAEILEEIEKQNHKFSESLDAAQRMINLLRERRAALISAAVTGKIDVREVALLA